MKNIVLFGGSGFLGTHLQSQLQGHIISVSLRNESWQGLVPANVDVFINVVGKAHDHKKTASPQDYQEANVDLVKTLFNTFLNSNAGLFIHISSIAVVEETGRPEPIAENSETAPESIYGRSKKEAEDFLLTQALPTGKQLVILRPPMIYGPGDKGNLKMLYQFAAKGLPYPLGAYDNQRTFIFVDNLAYLINKIISEPTLLTDTVYHVADDAPVSTMDIIRIAGETMHKKPFIIAMPRSLIGMLATFGGWLRLPLNPSRLKKMTSTLVVSNQKIKDALGIEKLPVSVQDGLQTTMSSFIKQN